METMRFSLTRLFSFPGYRGYTAAVGRPFLIGDLAAGRRHALCIEKREPALIHENGDLKHVLILDNDDLLYFDFEVTYRSPGKVRRHIARELLAFLRSLGRYAGREVFEPLVEDTRRYYPHPDLLRECYRVMYRHPNDTV